ANSPRQHGLRRRVPHVAVRTRQKPNRTALRSPGAPMTLAAVSWPAGRPRVLVTDAWLANAGDAAIALVVDRIIRRAAPGAAVLHAAYQHELGAATYPQLSFVPALDALVGAEMAPPFPRVDPVAGRDLVAAADVV